MSILVHFYTFIPLLKYFYLHFNIPPTTIEEIHLFAFNKCKDKRCKTCPTIGSVGNVTLENTACKTNNVEYMIRCGVCDIKYIGQTSLALNLRINNHRKLCNDNIFDNNDKYNSSKYEYEHFKIHPFSKVIIDILCIEPDQDKRLELENKYIIDLKTAYPFGLNDRVNNISVSAVKDKNCIYSTFFNNNSMSIPKTNRVRSKNRRNRHLDMNEFLDEICKDCFKKNNFIKYVKGKILGLSCKKAKVLISYLKTFKFDNSHVKDLIVDLIKFKTSKTDLEEDPYKFDSYLVIEFSHKYIDLLNVPRILRNIDLMNKFPRRETYPKISFKYSPTLGSLSFN